MADVDAVAEATAKLVLDDVTGEMVSKNELKKRTQKRAKKAATEKARAAAPKNSSKDNAPKPKPKQEETVADPDVIFKTGFLDEVKHAPARISPTVSLCFLC
jgi:glutaminyl-tRNA synthetase